jgi:hypothetical protein
MEPKHLFTIRWTQPYTQNTSFLQLLRDAYEQAVEASLEVGNFKEAKVELERIMKL